MIKEEILTEKQYEMLNVIKGYIMQHRYSPSLSDLRDILGKKSTSTIVAMLKILKRKNYIDYDAGKYRSIRIIERND
jgi:repressor LexA